MSKDETNDYKFLGPVFDWKADPEEFKNCFQQRHIMKVKELGRSHWEHYCDICKICYTSDSSD
jgi:hypothetical protein